MRYNFVPGGTAVIPVTADDITAVEEKYGIIFPDKLRDYYIDNNGKEMSTAFMEINGSMYWVSDFYAIKAPKLPLEKVLERQRLQHFPVRQMIPFASDGGGGIYYCHMMTGRIYLSFLNTENGFIEICPDIEVFFDILNEAYRRDEDNPFDVSEILRSEKKMAKVDYLPLGSIVLLKGGTRKVMIISRGLNVKRGDDTYFFDYGGVLYPEGLTGNEMLYFDHDGIIKVYFHGYADTENDVVVTSLNDYVENHPNINRADPLKWNPGV